MPIRYIQIRQLDNRLKWLVFTNFENKQLKILPDQNSDLKKKLYNYLSSEKATQYIDKENILKILYQFNVERTFKFNSENELYIFTIGKIDKDEQQEATNAHRGNNSSLQKIYSYQKFDNDQEISGKLDIWHFSEIHINNLSLKYINEKGIENYIKYEDLKKYGTLDPPFDETILTQA